MVARIEHSSEQSSEIVVWMPPRNATIDVSVQRVCKGGCMWGVEGSERIVKVWTPLAVLLVALFLFWMSLNLSPARLAPNLTPDAQRAGSVTRP